MKVWPVFACMLLLATEGVAQTGARPPRGWNVGIGAGGSAFTDFQRGTVRASRVSGGQIEEREFPRRVGAQTAGTLTGTLAYWPGKNWGVRIQGVWSGSRFETLMNPADAQFAGAPESSQDSTRLPSLSIRSYQGQLLFRMPTIHARIMPYGIVGGGVVEYTVGSGDLPLPPETTEDFNSGYRRVGAATVGLGAMINMRKAGWALNFELTDRVGRTPVRSSTAVSRLSPTMELIPIQDRPSDPVRTTSAVSFTVGLSWLVTH